MTGNERLTLTARERQQFITKATRIKRQHGLTKLQAEDAVRTLLDAFCLINAPPPLASSYYRALCEMGASPSGGRGCLVTTQLELIAIAQQYQEDDSEPAQSLCA